ncbi:uncharacterized protein J8A68_001742 [[Candida] subhashii]|uniref:Methyltransferase domain-containing protein n=1 Tax=[Candida] subhashii TaxID=561895 RepID=A0A8J5QT61_9ASCO|nr:uncharacterized protein J8A68_001742 [[Candida] subhashii]KAG7664717.1 hypothetical protein J8A68_001742 [[Candida] subhashii]
MTEFNQDSHQEAIKANLKMFNEGFAKKYDHYESQTIFSILFSKYLLEYDFKNPTNRKSLAETEHVIGDPYIQSNGLSVEKDLPDPKTYLTRFPNSIIKPGIKMLDFACGTGSVTEMFVPYLTDEEKSSELIGMDINPAFLKQFDLKADKYNSDKLEFKSYQYDLLDESVQSELSTKFENRFDLIICTLAYHHIDNYELVTKKLATFLKPQGWLFIIDLYNEDVDSPTPNLECPAVRHMGGLKLSKLNHTLSNIAGLENVSSARQFRTYIWQEDIFIKFHSPEAVIKKMQAGELESKDIGNDETGYLIECSIVYAAGQKK